MSNKISICTSAVRDLFKLLRGGIQEAGKILEV